jgi:hypothetical protein
MAERATRRAGGHNAVKCSLPGLLSKVDGTGICRAADEVMQA